MDIGFETLQDVCDQRQRRPVEVSNDQRLRPVRRSDRQRRRCRPSEGPPRVALWMSNRSGTTAGRSAATRGFDPAAGAQRTRGANPAGRCPGSRTPTTARTSSPSSGGPAERCPVIRTSGIRCPRRRRWPRPQPVPRTDRWITMRRHGRSASRRVAGAQALTERVSGRPATPRSRWCSPISSGSAGWSLGSGRRRDAAPAGASPR